MTDTFTTIVYIIFCILLFLIGFIVGRFEKSDGLFIVDDSEFGITRWTLDVNFDPSTITNRKWVRLKVKKMDKSSCE